MYQVLYKCRLCGELIYGDKISEGSVEVVQFYEGNAHRYHKAGDKMVRIPPEKSEILHLCSDGSVGAAVIQGFKKVDE